MTNSGPRPAALERVSTGIAGLDAVLRGGLLRGGVYVISGAPGTGKTILGNQVCFHHVAAGGRAMYVTLLTESHARMLAHLRSLAFFDPAPIADTLTYVSGYGALEQEGLAGLLDLLRRVLRQHQATMLVVDGLSSAELVAESELAYRRFLHDLQVAVETTNCTMLLLAHPTDRKQHPEHGAVDGLFELSSEPIGLIAVRRLQVHKFRGSDYLGGQHAFAITDDGIAVYPRTEALLAGVPREGTPALGARLDFGIARLDEMLRGGLPAGSTTMLFGAPGSGKTLLGMHFLVAGGAQGQPGLHFGFYEPPARLIEKAEQIDLKLGALVTGGLVELIRVAPLEHLLDALAERLLTAVRRRGVRRLFVDGLDGLLQAVPQPQRISRFFAALADELQARDVTTLLSVETRNLFGPTVEVPAGGVSELVDNIIFLRYVELRSQLYRLLSILKVRESEYDPALREFRITPHGIEVAATFESAEAILTGLARPLPPPDTPRRRAARTRSP